MKLKAKWKKLIYYTFIFICLFGVVFSSYKIIKWGIESKNSSKQINDLQEMTNINEKEDTSNTELVNETSNPKNSLYWKYIKMNLIDVDFKELKKVNNQTKGWIQVNGTNINYPFVQSKDNSYYLTRDFNKKYTDAGWVFLDYRNKLDGSDKNTILYAHARKDRTMFGSLKNILKTKWVNDKGNYIVKLSTEYENTLWQVFSIYRIPTNNDYIQTDFKSDNDYLTFLKLIKSRSSFNFKTNLDYNDKVLTLSTCYNDTDKVVLHAKLIKKEIRQ